MMVFVGGDYLVLENDSFQVAVYGSHGIKAYKKLYLNLYFKFWLYSRNSEIIFHNSDKKSRVISHSSGFFLRIYKLAIDELNPALII